ncbi:Chitodextrinase [Enterobacter sp. CC120223-11]|nr:Chitodextrinase [Enterobacter sp. CC120223-11]
MKLDKIALSFLASSILLTFQAHAYDKYDSSKAYQGGAKVTWQGGDFEAQWYANPGEKPDPSVVNAWDNVWKKIAGSTEPDPKPEPEPDPDPKPEPGPSDHPQFLPGSQYKQGDIVSNQGKDYICKVATWCSSSADAYRPGEGWAWNSAWDLYGAEPEPGLGLTQKELDEREAELTNTPQLIAVKNALKTLGNDAVERIKPGADSNPANVKRVERIITADKWETFFPHRDPAYTYENFLKAVGKFPILCGEGEDADAVCKKTLATMFAHFVQETGEHASQSDVAQWQQGLHWVREMGLDENTFDKYTGATCDPDTWQGKAWPCAKDAQGRALSYFGRGAKQLSYNFNYGAFSQAMYGDVNKLLKEPWLVADTWLNLASAIFFYVQPQPPKPSMQAVIDGSWQPNGADKASGLVPGFGVTTQIINGGVECGGTVEVAQSLNRIEYYKAFAEQLGVPVPESEVLGCKGMKQFGESGSAAMPLFWVKDDSYVAANPGGKSYACKLVNWQENDFSALTKGDYTRCVKASFPDVVIKP